MQLEVMRRESRDVLPAACSTRLEQIQGVLSQEILNVRDLMQMLKPVDVGADRLVAYLADVVDRFRQRTGIQAQLICQADDLELTPRVCREIAATVQEALANVRKHSGASTVVVRLSEVESGYELTIDDNGRGFPFEGRLELEDLDSRRVGPVVIKERVRSIAGHLAVCSQPGSGSKLEIMVPRKHHA